MSTQSQHYTGRYLFLSGKTVEQVFGVYSIRIEARDKASAKRALHAFNNAAVEEGRKYGERNPYVAHPVRN